MNPLNKDEPYHFMVAMKKKRRRDKQKPLKSIIIMADSTDLAWGLFRKQYGTRYDIVELAPRGAKGEFIKRLGFKDRVKEGIPNGGRGYKENR